jgi:hypothetical protein
MDGSRKYIAQLTLDARERLESITRNGSAPAKKILHARVLLMSNPHHAAGRYRDHEIAAALGIHINTVARIRKLFVQQGEQPALDRKARLRPPVLPKLYGHAEAALVTLCCSTPSDGCIRWILNMLQQEAVGRKIVTSICRETIRKTLKKTSNLLLSTGFPVASIIRPSCGLHGLYAGTSTGSSGYSSTTSCS